MQSRNRLFLSSLQPRQGKILCLFAVLLPAVFSVLALFLDGGMLEVEYQRCRHAADAAATAAALELLTPDGGTPADSALQTARVLNDMPDVTVTTHVPPVTGAYAGRDGYAEVSVVRHCPGYFVKFAGISDPLPVEARAVAGIEASTEPAAIVILDENPPAISLGPLPVSLPSVLPLLGGLEVLGLGRLRVNGAILVNNRWGGMDENGDLLETVLGLRNACSCTPLLPLTHVAAPDVRVVGGVDDPDNYRPLQAGERSPLKANSRPVPDPYASLPVPTIDADPTNVVMADYGGVSVVNIPLLQPPRVLHPGVYDWIQIVSGRVVFEPGVYIIRGANPATGIGLNLLTGSIRAEGVMFYLTDSGDYSPVTGMPDRDDGLTAPPPHPLTLVPSAIIDTALLNSSFEGLDSPGSPFHGMLIFQRRTSRRPIVFVQQSLLGSTNVAGNIYARSAHLILTAHGTYRSAFAVGSLRSVTLFETRVEPEFHLPPAHDVYLVE